MSLGLLPKVCVQLLPELRDSLLELNLPAQRLGPPAPRLPERVLQEVVPALGLLAQGLLLRQLVAQDGEALPLLNAPAERLLVQVDLQDLLPALALAELARKPVMLTLHLIDLPLTLHHSFAQAAVRDLELPLLNTLLL